MFKVIRKIFEINAKYFVERPIAYLFELGMFWIALYTIITLGLRKIDEKLTSNKKNTLD